MSSTDVPSVTMNTGSKMPAVGKGCWLGADGGLDYVEEMCKNAIKTGYRHLDTASGYRNEALVGKAIRESGVPRSEIFVTTKLPSVDHHRVRESFEESLAKLGLDYVDLYLMHWPQTEIDGKTLSDDEHPNFIDAWKDMEKLLETEKVRAIGVSNFSIKTLEALLEHATVVPANNQVEVNVCLPQFELQEYCEKKGIVLSAYSPFGQGNGIFFEDPDFKSVVEAHKANPGQIAVSWLVQRGVPALPKSANLERMKSNIALVRLTNEEMEKINSIHKKPGMHRSLLKYHRPEGTVFGWTYDQLGWPLKVGGFAKE